MWFSNCRVDCVSTSGHTNLKKSKAFLKKAALLDVVWICAVLPVSLLSMTLCVEQEDKLGSTVVFPGSHNSWSSFSSLFPWIQHIP